jgi:PAS domain S-box-containing protein
VADGWRRDDGEGDERYRRILDDQTEFIVRWRPDGVRTFVNDSYCRYFGVTRGDAVGSSFYPLISHDDLAAVRRRIAALSPEHPASTGEHRVVRPDGTIGWNRWTDRAFFDAEGNIVELQSVGLDVTERVEAERALRESQARLSLIYDSTREYMALLRVMPGGDYAIESCNQSFVNLHHGLGRAITRAELVGMELRSFFDRVLGVTAEKVAFVYDRLSAAAAAPGSIEYEEETELESMVFHTATTVTPIRDETGRCTHLLWVATDISARKRTEERLRRALAEVEQLSERLRQENVYLRDELEVEHQFAHIVGSSEPLRRVLRDVEQVAATDATVLILGETGTGKELVARGIHELSARKERPLVKVNCAALPAELVESELFGHERGAFTSAVARRIGRFELANRGTLFLDEIGELPRPLQAKLLRVLQDGEFERVGGEQTLRVSVRVIAATNRDLDRLVREGAFREDLFFRLNVFPIHLPPLRERREDVLPLVRHFVERLNARLGRHVSTIPSRTIDTLSAYDWPGNVRELENIVERAMVVSVGERLEVGDWFVKRVPTNGAAGSTDSTMREVERHHINGVLERTRWRVSGRNGAAEVLGLKPTTLEARMKRLGITRPR